VTALAVEPPEPKSKPAQFFFRVSFLNTGDGAQTYPRWRVLIFPRGETRATGDPQSDTRVVPVGASELTTRMWDINTPISCEPYTAQPIWEDESGTRTRFTQPDGTRVELDFQVCP
jgi:hypothetical protein